MDLHASAAILNLGGIVLWQVAVFSRPHLSKRIFWQWATIGAALLMVSNWLFSLGYDAIARMLLGITGAGYGALAGYCYARWRKHKDDDDDFGKRAKRWLTNRLPRPRVRATRTTGL